MLRELSGGEWICSFSHENEPTGTAQYSIAIPEGDDYHLWVRAVGGTGLSYRLDDAEEAVDVDVSKGHDAIPIAADGSPFYPPRAEWFDLGTLPLTKGKHEFTWHLGGLKAKDRWGGMDCFVLTAEAFAPRGKYQPSEQAPEPILAFQPGQTWDFLPDADEFNPAALLDLRRLNEKVAGEHGFIKLSEDGNSFVRGGGHEERRDLHHYRRVLGRFHKDGEELGGDQPGPRQSRGPRLLRPEVPGRLQGLDGGHLHASQPLHGRQAGRRAGRGHHPTPERRQPVVVGGYEPQGRRARALASPVCPLPQTEIWLATRNGRAEKGGDPGFEDRAADQLEFLARTMHKFHADMAEYLREGLGCKQLINANNWRTVDLVATQDAEYWACTANEVIARNIYTGGMHQGVNNGWQILPGHYYSDVSLTKEPLRRPR